MKKDNSETRSLLLAVLLSAIILGFWQYFVELPRKRVQAEQFREQARVVKQEVQKNNIITVPTRKREELIAETPRLRIVSDYLHGSLSLKGLRFDDLTLAHYRETLDPTSPEVILFSPAYDKDGYFSEIGWLAPKGTTITLPDRNTLWTADGTELTPEKPVTLTWKNPEGITFSAAISLDKAYMFTITQSAKDASGNAVPQETYAYVNRVYDIKQHSISLVHEGPIAVYDGILKTTSFKELAGGKQQETDVTSGGWIGISDKYWFSSIIPSESAFNSRIYSYTAEDGRERYQVDYAGVQPEKETTLHLFAGAKELKLLDAYAQQYHIVLFDRAVDFGKYFYILSKPIFFTLSFFYSLVGNFGIAIMLLTVLVKLIMYPMADKSYKSMAQMSLIRPKMQEIQQRNKDDKMKLNQEMMELYKREKVNPASGCLPALIQIPVFIALYNTLYATIEMRHAPFFGWIRDLSAPDPTNVFTLFGLIQWTPPALMHVGIWPMIMATTMYLQQSQSPPPPDPTQARMMKYLPLMFLFMFSNVAAGLVIYWAWSNTISIVQQWHIKKRYGQIKR